MSDPPVAVDRRTPTEAWIDRGPLRTWRHSQDPPMSLMDTASRLGVGMSMMQAYEKGVHKPRLSAHPKFEALLGEGWLDRWDAWLADRPDR